MVQFPMKMARVVSKVVADGTCSEEDHCRETLGLYGASWDARDCQQNRQQRCTEGAGPGSGGVILDSSVKSGIFCLKTTLKATDSDLRLQYSLRILLPRCNYLLSTPLTQQTKASFWKSGLGQSSSLSLAWNQQQRQRAMFTLNPISRPGRPACRGGGFE